MEDKRISIYLDDSRDTPNFFTHRTYSVEDTIQLLSTNNGNVYMISLDNDLGYGYEEGRKVMDWIEAAAFENTLLPIPHLIIHTDNTVARDAMMTARANAWKYWKMHGYDRSDFI